MFLSRSVDAQLLLMGLTWVDQWHGSKCNLGSPTRTKWDYQGKLIFLLDMSLLFWEKFKINVMKFSDSFP